MHCFSFLLFIFIVIKSICVKSTIENGQCSLGNIADCASEVPKIKSKKYSKEYNEIELEIQNELDTYKPCAEEEHDEACNCHANVIAHDLAVYRDSNGITRQMIKDSEQFGTLYKILDHKLYRAAECMFPARCSGIEHFLLRLLPDLPNLDLVINTRDWPQVPSARGNKRIVFSFSKTKEYADIMYPAWTFWAGGPAISLFPTGIGRWDKLRNSLTKTAASTPWSDKQTLAFFRGSRTSDERDSLVLLSRRRPDLVDAQYTKNQAWKSPKDTLNAEPAKEVSFEQHCQYKYLFNYRGVAASFRLKHLFLCKSVVLHVGDDWNEFFYFALKPWVHYVPLKSYPSEDELERILLFLHEHDDLAKQIANRGYEFIRRHLKMSDIECYWRKLLIEYKKLFNFTVATNKHLIEIKA